MGAELIPKQGIPPERRSDRFAALFLEWLSLFGALVLFSLPQTHPLQPIAGFFLLAIFFLIEAVQGKLFKIRTGLELPLLLFVVSAGLSTWISYNQGPALIQLGRILVSVGLFIALVDSRPKTQEIVAIGFLFIATALASYWLIHNDLTQIAHRLVGVGPLTQSVRAILAKNPLTHAQHDLVAGALLASIPFGFVLSWTRWRKMDSIRAIGLWQAILFTFCTGIILVALATTDSNGAWMGLAALGAAVGLVILQRKWFPQNRSKTIFWLAISLLGLIIVTGLIYAVISHRFIDPSNQLALSLQSRLGPWKDGLFLARDYLFTGSGLQTFPMIHAVYSLMIHVPYLDHVHNSLLEIWLEQGLLGCLAVLWGGWVVLRWAWNSLNRQGIPPLGWAGLAALFACLVHGVVDVAFYDAASLPIVGLLLGFTTLIRDQPVTTLLAAPQSGQRRKKAWWLPALILTFFGLILLIFWQSLAAAWYANLGALEQTRVELSQYNPAYFETLSLDQVRQNSDLDTAQAYFQQALQFQPDHLSALQRLAAIALARQHYSQALDWMSTAWQSGNRDRVTRLLYGDALIASGDFKQAADIIAGVEWAESRLLFQVGYRYWENRDYPRAAYALQAILTINPNNTEAADWLAKAQHQINR